MDSTQIASNIREWTDQKIAVFAFRVPSSKEMVELENKFSGFDEDKFRDEFISSGGIWFSFDINKYHSYDGSHLHKDSAIQFSKDLAQQIKETISRGQSSGQ